MEKGKGLKLEHIQEAVKYIFDQKPKKDKKVKFNYDILRITEDKDYEFYNLGFCLTCGFSGMCELYDTWKSCGLPMEIGIKKVFYNGEELNDQGIASFWQQFLKRKENYETNNRT